MITTHKSTRTRKQICIEQCGDIAVGIDTHKKTLSVCFWSAEYDCLVKKWVQPADAQSLIRSLSPFRKQITRIAYEAGPTGFVLARALAADGWPVIVTSPADIPKGRNDAKSDDKDARRIARLAGKNMLPCCWIPTVAQEDERRMVRVRGRVLCDKSRVQLRIKSLLLCNGIPEPAGLRYWSKAGIQELKNLQCTVDLRCCLNAYLWQLEGTMELLYSCNQRLKQLAQRPHNLCEIEVLITIGGIGELTSLVFIVEMGPRGRFENRLEVSKYQGLAPEVQSTGDSRTELDINNSGNRWLRAVLIEAAWRWIGYDEAARELYRRMLHNTGNKNKAIVAVARKLGIVMWRMRESQTTYRSEHTTEHDR